MKTAIILLMALVPIAAEAQTDKLATFRAVFLREVKEAGIVGIHHPEGSWKRAFFGKYESTSIGCGAECGCFTPANYAFYSDVNGIVEKGSSGSAMFTAAGQVIGQLFGTCSLCPDALDCWQEVRSIQEKRPPWTN